jgi:hypothetical protein
LSHSTLLFSVVLDCKSVFFLCIWRLFKLSGSQAVLGNAFVAKLSASRCHMQTRHRPLCAAANGHGSDQCASEPSAAVAGALPPECD